MPPKAAMVLAMALVLSSQAARGRQPEGGGVVVKPLDGDWLLAVDPRDVGRARKWFEAPRPDARSAPVPGIIQDPFPGCHGVAWYWKDFTAPVNPHLSGRFLLRFWAADYKAEVWLNGSPVGGHEGGEEPFVLDVTDRIRPGAANRIAVRLLNPTPQRIDGLLLDETPRRAKVMPYSAGASYNYGGLVDSVELLAVPGVYLEDLCLKPQREAERILVRAQVRNTEAGRRARFLFTAAPASGGASIDSISLDRELAAGTSTVDASLKVDAPHVWDLADPFLYRVTVRVFEPDSSSFDERSDRCGFRDFRFADGHFRLNGRRIFLRSAHTVNTTPVGQRIPHDPGLFRRDLLYMKTMGFNCIRFIWGAASRAQLDFCDELGLMAYVESPASRPIADSPQMAERFDRAVSGMIRRDRNHPGVIAWGLLNESRDVPAFRHAVAMLPLVRALDETRLVALNSGRWDGRLDAGSFSNPGSAGWDCYLGAENPDGARSQLGTPDGYCPGMGDVHAYPRVPHTAATMDFLRTLGRDTGPVFLSEYGIGSAMDLWRVVRQFEQIGRPQAEEAVYYGDRLNRFLSDWKAWRLEECFASPGEFFRESQRKMAGQRTLGLNAIRANPRIVGHNVTGMLDHVNCGEGLFTLFRELKPGTVDAVSEALAPLRLCLFAEPPNLVPGRRVKLEAVLANEDALPPGEYPVRLRVRGPGGEYLLDRTVPVNVPAGDGLREAPLAIPFFAEEIAVDGPPGAYRFLAALERGGAATGGDAVFHMVDPASFPDLKIPAELWGDDPVLERWLEARGALRPPRAPGIAAGGDVILVGQNPESGDAAWKNLVERITRGATAIFLSPEVFRTGEDSAARLPLEPKGSFAPIQGWLYLKDEWAKEHPIFGGLPAGGLMDYGYYREIIPDLVFSGQGPPLDAVCGAIKASQDYESGLMVAVFRLGLGRMILNTLLIRENLGNHPAADRLLINMLNYAASPAN